MLMRMMVMVMIFACCSLQRCIIEFESRLEHGVLQILRIVRNAILRNNFRVIILVLQVMLLIRWCSTTQLVDILVLIQLTQFVPIRNLTGRTNWQWTSRMIWVGLIRVHSHSCTVLQSRKIQLSTYCTLRFTSTRCL